MAFGSSHVKFVETAGGITGAGNSMSGGGTTGGGADGVVLWSSSSAFTAISATSKAPLHGSAFPLRSTRARRPAVSLSAGAAAAGSGRQRAAGAACF